MPKRFKPAGIIFLTSATLICSAQQSSVDLELSHLPPAVQKTIGQQKGDGKLESIEKLTDDGEVTYDVELVRDGKSRGFTVDAEGELLNEEVFAGELSPAIQQTIQKQVGNGTLDEIDKCIGDGNPSYDVQMTRDGKTRCFTVATNGQLLDAEVFLSELPPALQTAIQKQVGGDKLAEIRKCFDGDEITYDVHVTGNGEGRILSFDPDGTFWYEEGPANLSDTPEAVQKQIKTLTGSGKLLGISKTMEDNEISYEVDVQNGAQEKTTRVGPDGKVLPDAMSE